MELREEIGSDLIKSGNCIMTSLGTLPENFDDFRQAWIDDIIHGEQSPTAKGRAFALKIIHQWLDIDAETDEENDSLFYCDGAGDGGIDLAYLKRGDVETGEGDTWYLVQSKYGSAFQGSATLFEEGIKVIETLEGENLKLSTKAKDLQERLELFRQSQSAKDKLVLVFATVDALPDKEYKALKKLRAAGKDSLPFNFDVEAVSVRTIFDRLGEQASKGVRVPLPFVVTKPEADAELLVGTVTLPDVYGFLRDYKQERGDLQLLYAKNVRQYLTSSSINKKIVETLNATPERFGLYNNGITIVVNDYSYAEGTLTLVNPSVVNGCQTTRSIFDVFDKKLNSGGTGQNNALVEWQVQAGRGLVTVKIVRVNEQSDELLEQIVRFTNSQNSVRDQDFLALEGRFKNWQKEMAKHGIYLEIQRGGSESQKAIQKANPTTQQFDSSHFANAFDLLKVYGAGWLRQPGNAWSKNKAFAPNGEYYNQLVDGSFDTHDLVECFYLQQAADDYQFGKKAFQTRRITRFLFYFVTLELLRRLLKRNNYADDAKSCTEALRLLRLAQKSDLLLDAALHVVDNYMTSGDEDSFAKDPDYETRFGGNVNNYLKSDGFAKTERASPGLYSWLKSEISSMSKAGKTEPSDEKQIAETWLGHLLSLSDVSS